MGKAFRKLKRVLFGSEPEAWMRHAKCRDMDPATFFPSDGVGVEAARKICAACRVRGPCLEYALRYRIVHGVWGGTSERERRRILKVRAAFEGTSLDDQTVP